jgi:alcohol dehydrogenase class IV
MFSFQSKTKIIQTDDYIREVLKILESEKAKKILVVYDSAVTKTASLENLKLCLQRKKCAVILLAVPLGEPLTTEIDRTGKSLKKNPPGLIIGIGGGSALDFAKALSVLAVNPGLTDRYHGKPITIKRAVPKIMIPTTAGTGSEVTPGAVLTNPKTQFKRALGGPMVCPEYAILDASLTLSMPRWVTFSTAMDALAHVVESYVCKSANEMTRMYSRTAYSLIEKNLPRLLHDPNNLEARKKILLASTLAGVSIFNSNTGAAHALAYAMGIYAQVPHGLATAVLLPEIIRLNIRKGCFHYSGLISAMGSETKKQKKKLSKKVLRFAVTSLKKTELKKLLGKYKLKQHISLLAQKGLDLKPALKNNPVNVEGKDFRKILRNL